MVIKPASVKKVAPKPVAAKVEIRATRSTSPLIPEITKRNTRQASPIANKKTAEYKKSSPIKKNTPKIYKDEKKFESPVKSQDVNRRSTRHSQTTKSKEDEFR